MNVEEYLLKHKTPEEILEIMIEALDLMESYNGRSKTYCIVTAMNGTCEAQDDGSYIYTVPTITTITTTLT